MEYREWEWDGDLFWVGGADYLSEWREARGAAAEINDVLAAAGLTMRAVASTDDEGRAVVRLRGTPLSVRKVARTLRDGQR